MVSLGNMFVLLLPSQPATWGFLLHQWFDDCAPTFSDLLCPIPACRNSSEETNSLPAYCCVLLASNFKETVRMNSSSSWANCDTTRCPEEMRYDILLKEITHSYGSGWKIVDDTFLRCLPSTQIISKQGTTNYLQPNIRRASSNQGYRWYTNAQNVYLVH